MQSHRELTGQSEQEIVTVWPLDGSFIRLAGRMVDPALGVAVGWNHFFAQTSYVIFEATIINTLVEYWGYDESPAILISVSLVVYLAINVWRADLFGEIECESPNV
jgi:amino acid transporter